MSNSRLEGALEKSDATAPYSGEISLLAKGAAIFFVGSVASGGLRYLFQVIIARQVGVELFGLFSLGLVVFNLAGAVASLGMVRGMIRFVSLYQGEGDWRRVKGTIHQAAIFALGGGIVVSLTLITGAEMLATRIFHSEEMTNVLKGFAIAIPFCSLTMVLLASTQALRLMQYKVLVRDLLEPLSRIVLALLLFLLGWKLGGVISAYVMSIVAGTFLSFLFYRKVFHPIVGRSVQPVFETKRLLAFSWPLLFATSFYSVEIWISPLILGYFATPRDVGIFSAAYRTSLLVLAIFTSFNPIFAPVISDLYHRDQLTKLEHLFKLVAKWSFSLCLPVALLMIIFAQEIMTIFGRDFVVGAMCLIILSVGQLIYSATGHLGVMIDMSGRSKLTLLNSVLHLSLQISLGFLLVPLYGLIGAAIANTISIGFQRVIRLVQVHLFLKMNPFHIKFLNSLIAGGLSWLVLSLIRVSIPQIGNSPLFLIPGSLIFLTVYGLTLYRLGFDEADKLILHKLGSKLGFSGRD